MIFICVILRVLFFVVLVVNQYRNTKFNWSEIGVFFFFHFFKLYMYKIEIFNTKLTIASFDYKILCNNSKIYKIMNKRIFTNKHSFGIVKEICPKLLKIWSSFSGVIIFSNMNERKMQKFILSLHFQNINALYIYLEWNIIR